MGRLNMWAAVIIMAITVVLLQFLADGRVSAGADWYRHGSQWVSTYDLTKVMLGRGYSERTLTLADGQGREVSSRLSTLQADPELWSLVYNGILHSVHHGDAEIDDFTYNWLALGDHIPEPPQLTHRRRLGGFRQPY
ncbi:hypothetical protein ABGB12_20550 [Actinocorallia sp. B10E7]|uniref:hypothetical protein n=1 Tax=Actinocorallia sp. B10E7 TaxID=3153558 RepID=UPI00325C3999